MKNLILGALLLLSTTAYSQYHIDSLYQNLENNLLYSVVQDYDSLTQDVLNTKVKNWAGTAFVNLSEVLVGDTKEQIVIRFISDDFYIKMLGMATVRNWYIRVVIQMKDNKIKMSFYDDGNAFWPGSYTGTTTVPAVQPVKYHFNEYAFKKEGIASKMCNEGIASIKPMCINMANSLSLSIRTAATPVSNDGW
jgi:hypothetical protein